MSRPAAIIAPLILVILAVAVTTIVLRTPSDQDDSVAESPTEAPTDGFEPADPTDTASPEPGATEPTEPQSTESPEPVDPVTPEPAPTDAAVADGGQAAGSGQAGGTGAEGTLPLTGQTAVGGGLVLLIAGAGLALLRRRPGV